MFPSATSAMRVNVLSPLVGEGLSAISHALTRVRGLSAPSLPKQPLTRLRFAKPPSPTRGEGKSAPHLSASIT